MKKYYTLILCVMIVLLSSCKGKKDENVNTQATTKLGNVLENVTDNNIEPETEPIKEEPTIIPEPIIDIPDKLDFVSARGEWYSVDVNRNFPLTKYDKEKFVRDGEKMAFMDEQYTYRLGIDVSKYQGDIDWNKVKADGYEFAFVRMGYRGYGPAGTLVVDDMAISNIKGAKEAGLDVGVYFFSQAVTEEEAKAEVSFVLELLSNAGIGKDYLTMPIVYDVEHILDDEARTDDVTGEQFTKNALAFLRSVEAAGYDACFYSNMLWEAYQFDLDVLRDFKIWYADYEAKPQTPYRFEFWQYSEKGKVDGIYGACDLDIEIIKK